MNKSRRNYNLPFGKASRTATRIYTPSPDIINSMDHGHEQEETNCPKPDYMKDTIQPKASLDETVGGNDFPFIQGCSHNHLPHPKELLQSRKRKKKSSVEKEKGFPKVNSHLHEVQSKFARTVYDTMRDDDKETLASNYRYLESEVKENLPDYDKMAKKTSMPLRSSVSTAQKYKALKHSTQVVNSEATLSENDQNTDDKLKGSNHPLETSIIESWEEMEEVIHKRWKSKHWLYLPQDSHLPEQ